MLGNLYYFKGFRAIYMLIQTYAVTPKFERALEILLSAKPTCLKTIWFCINLLN